MSVPFPFAATCLSCGVAASTLKEMKTATTSCGKKNATFLCGCCGEIMIWTTLVNHLNQPGVYQRRPKLPLVAHILMGPGPTGGQHSTPQQPALQPTPPPFWTSPPNQLWSPLPTPLSTSPLDQLPTPLPTSPSNRMMTPLPATIASPSPYIHASSPYQLESQQDCAIM